MIVSMLSYIMYECVWQTDNKLPDQYNSSLELGFALQFIFPNIQFYARRNKIKVLVRFEMNTGLSDDEPVVGSE